MLKPYLKLALLTLFYLLVIEAKAQVSITVLDSTNAYSQNFNGLSTTANTPWVNNSTLPNWYMEASKIAGTNINVSNGSSATGAFYNFGSTGSTDRTLGSINSGTTGHYYYGIRMKNNTSVTVRAFSIMYTGEQWRHSKENAQKLTFSYRTSTGAITTVSGGGWTNVSALDFTSPVKGGKPAALNGNLAANRRLKSYTITNINLPPGSEIMFRWTDTEKGGDDHALGIDDVTIVPFNPIDFFSEANGNLNDLNTWGTNTDGSGLKPLNFTSPYQIFHIQNSATKSINHDWAIKGFGSKAILDNNGNAINFTIPIGHLMKGDIDIMPNATLTINNQIPPSIGYIETNTTVVYGYNKGNQNIEPADYFNLTIAGGGDKLLTDAVTVNGTLAFTSGYINLGNYDLIMGSGTTITGASATNYIKTTGNGSLTREIDHNATVTFPIGTATSYNPAVITNTGEMDIFSASVLPMMYSSYDENLVPNGGAILNDVVSRTWIITEDIEGGSIATVQLQWNTGDEMPDLDRSKLSLSQYQTDYWATSAYAAATGTGPYTRSLTGVTTFSIFGINDPNASFVVTPLPVELLYFKAKANINQAVLTWATASEKNNDKFVIEKSTNGFDWTIAGEVKGIGTSATMSTYSFTDNNVASRQYYRLKQIDFDGTFNYSNIELLTFSRKTDNHVTLLANPVQENIKFNLNGNDLNQATLDIYTTTGAQVNRQILTKGALRNGCDISTLVPGIYLYRISDSHQVLGSGSMVKTN